MVDSPVISGKVTRMESKHIFRAGMNIPKVTFHSHHDWVLVVYFRTMHLSDPPRRIHGTACAETDIHTRWEDDKNDFSTRS